MNKITNVNRIQMAQQCELKQMDGQTLISWIPAEAATVGRKIRLKLGNEKLSALFTITQVWQTCREWDWIWERSRDWTHTRKASDI